MLAEWHQTLVVRPQTHHCVQSWLLLLQMLAGLRQRCAVLQLAELVCWLHQRLAIGPPPVVWLHQGQGLKCLPALGIHWLAVGSLTFLQSGSFVRHDHVRH